MAQRAFRATHFPPLPEIPELQYEAHAPAVAPTADSSPLAGVNAFAYLRGEFGLGESARLYIRALLKAGYPVALNDIALHVPHGLNDRTLEYCIRNVAPFGTNLIFVNPDHLAQALDAMGSEKTKGRYTIACWFWELETIPEDWHWALNQVDEIMVSSSFVEHAFRCITEKPILRVPMPIGEGGDSGLMREDFGLPPDKFIFLSSFDFNSSLHRKNPFAVIDAFRKAFPTDREDVQLLLKSSNGYRHPDDLYRLLAAAALDPRVVVRDDVIDGRHMHALQRCADAYVSLHCAEGFGLGLAECMALGKPVVGTAWSGNLDFMNGKNSCLVDYRLVPVEKGEYPHAEGARWALADVDDAAIYMRKLVDEPLFASRIGAQAALDIRNNFSSREAARTIIQRLDELQAKSDLKGSDMSVQIPSNAHE